MNGHTPYIKVALRVRIELYRANEWYILYQELYHKICHCHNNNLYSMKNDDKMLRWRAFSNLANNNKDKLKYTTYTFKRTTY